MKRNFEKRWKVLKDLWLPFAENDVSKHAASACFYIFLSLLPASALGMTLLSLLPNITPIWIKLVDALIPDELLSIAAYFLSAITPRRPAGLLSFWLLLTLWSASKGIMSISDGLSEILGVEARRGFIRRRLRAMIVFLFLFVVVSATMILIIFGVHIFDQLTQLLPKQSGLLHILFQLRYALTLVFLASIFSIFYGLMQKDALTCLSCIKCGLLSSAGWLICSFAFSIYVNQFQSYQRLYGSLGLLLLACLWLQIVISLLLYSAIYVKLRQDGSYHPVAIIKEAFL